MSRQRQYSGVGSRSCKSCWLRLRTGKYRSVIIIVVIFSAWLSLHFVRAAIEYHQQVAKEKVKDMLMKANAYHGNGEDDDDGVDDVSSSSTESYSTEPWQNPTNFVFRPLFPGSRDINFNKGDNLDSWSSSTSTVGSTEAAFVTGNDRDEKGIGGVRDMVTTKPLLPDHALNEAEDNLLKQLHEDTTGSAEETTHRTTEGFTKAGAAGNYFREDSTQTTSTSSDFDLEVAMTTDIMIGNTASNDNKNANIMKIVNNQQYIVKPAPVETNNFKVAGDLRADKEDITLGFTDETTTTLSDTTTDFETVTEMWVLGDASNNEVSITPSNEDNLKFVAQADQIINSLNDNIAVQTIGNSELPNQEQIPGKSHSVSDQPLSVNPPKSNTVPKQSQSKSDAQSQIVSRPDNIKYIVPDVAEPTDISQQNLNDFPQDKGAVPIVNQQNLAEQSNSAQFQYDQQYIPAQNDIRTSGESYVNPSFIHHGYPLPQQQYLNPTKQQVDQALQVQPYPAGQQPSNQAVQQQNYPANIQQHYDSIQQPSYPAIQEKNYPAIQQSNYPDIQKQNYPAEQQHSYTGIQQHNHPDIPVQKQIYPAEHQQNNPAIQQQNYPAIQQQNYPAIQQQNFPAIQQQNFPAIQQQNYPAEQQQSSILLQQNYPVLPQQNYLDTQQQNSALPQQNYLATKQQNAALQQQNYLATQQQNAALPQQNYLATQQQNYQAVPQQNNLDILQQKQQQEPVIQQVLNSDRQNHASPTIQRQTNMATQRDDVPQTSQGIQQIFRQAVQKHLKEQMIQQEASVDSQGAHSFISGAGVANGIMRNV